MTYKTALIIFIKNPVPGKAKTRLAEWMGEEEALAIYRDLLVHTRKITDHLNCSKFLYYSDYMDDNDEWDNETYLKRLQLQTDNLGQRMQDAFTAVFTEGFGKVVIIGSDSMELTEQLIREAFIILDGQDMVIGPAKDGGYYLLGMKKMHPDLFLNKKWSSPTVFKDTLDNIHRLKITYKQLPVLSDVDRPEDIQFMN